MRVTSGSTKSARVIDSADREGRAHKKQPLTTRHRTPQPLSVAAAAALSIVTFLNAASEEATLCPDILYLIEQSRSQFLAVRGDTGSDFGDYDATLVLPDAWHCVILEDVEKTTYKCTWKYPLGDEQAHQTFQRFAKELRNCIGHIAGERTDQSANHPDSYASYYYQLPSGAASVSLKNKAELMSTLVSIRIDGSTKTQ